MMIVAPTFRIGLLVSVLCFMGGPAEARQDPFAVRPRLQRIDEAPRVAEGDVPAGLPAGESLAEFRRALGRIHRQISEGRLDRALSMIESAQLTYGAMPDLLYLGARAATMNQDWPRADRFLAQLMDTPANELQQFDYLSRWGHVLIQLQRFEQAEDVLKQVLELQPYEPSNIYHLMLTQIALGRIDAAQELPRRLRLVDLGELCGVLHQDFPEMIEQMGEESYWQLAAALIAGGETAWIQEVPAAPAPADDAGNMLLLTRDDTRIILPETGIPVADMQRRVRVLQVFASRNNELMERNQFDEVTNLVATIQGRYRSIRAPAVAAAGALARVRSGDNEAIEALRSLAEQYPRNVAPALLYIEALLEAGDFDTAATAAQTFNRQHPSHSLGLLYLAAAYAGSNRSIDAQDALDTLPMILQPLIVHWLSTPRPYYRPLLEEAHFEAWRQGYLRMGR